MSNSLAEGMARMYRSVLRVSHRVEDVSLDQPLQVENDKGEKNIVYPITVYLRETHGDGGVYVIELKGHVVATRKECAKTPEVNVALMTSDEREAYEVKKRNGHQLREDGHLIELTFPEALSDENMLGVHSSQ